MKEKIAHWLPDYSESKMYGMFGYEGMSIDACLARDFAPGIEKAHALGWITPTAKTLLDTPIRRLAIERGHHECAAVLKALGYPE